MEQAKCQGPVFAVCLTVQFDLGCHVHTNIIFATSDMSLMLDHDHVRMRMSSYYRSKVSSLTCVYVSLSTYI